jgi:hypothetical protein
MAISRRKFLKAGTLIAFSAAIPLKASAALLAEPNDAQTLNTAANFPASKESLRSPISYYKRTTFAPLLNTEFQIHGDPEKVKVKLVEVGDAAATKTSAERAARTRSESFSLVFKGSASQRLPQNNYTIEHAGIGKFSLFLVPVGRGKKGRHYQAIINRL